MNSIKLKLCDIQGRLFTLSADQGYESRGFVSFFMNSAVARALDQKYNRMQWAGEEYLLEELLAESGGSLTRNGKTASGEVMFWIGYLYRYWHFCKGEDSAAIYCQADFTTMQRNYRMFHTMDPELAIDDLIEMHRQKSG